MLGISHHIEFVIEPFLIPFQFELIYLFSSISVFHQILHKLSYSSINKYFKKNFQNLHKGVMDLPLQLTYLCKAFHGGTFPTAVITEKESGELNGNV